MRVKPTINPEKIVQGRIVTFLREHGFFVNVVDSKAVFSHYANRYLHGMATKGFPDLVGVCPEEGLAFFCEVKSCESKLKSAIKKQPEQVKFLVNVIKKGGFGCYGFDERQVFGLWGAFFTEKKENRQKYLLDQLRKYGAPEYHLI